MNNELIIGQGLGHQLEQAFARNGWTKEQVNSASGGEFLGNVRLVLEEKAKIVLIGSPVPTAPASGPWTVDEEGNTHFAVVSNGFTPKQCVADLENRGLRLSNFGRDALLRAAEAPTNGVTYNIVMRLGNKISDSNRFTNKIRAHAITKGWQTPHWEIAYLIRIKFTDEQLKHMGLWYIVTMHEPIVDSKGDSRLLFSDHAGGDRYLGANNGRPSVYWNFSGGFAFVVSQVIPQNSVR